jgi:hypothetical protein
MYLSLVGSHAHGQHSQAGFGIVPNPLTGGYATLRYSLDQAGYARIAIYDVMGSQVKDLSCQLGRTGTMSVDLRGLPSGQYIVRMDAGKNSLMQALLIVADGGSSVPTMPYANSWPEVRAATMSGHAFGMPGGCATLSPNHGAGAFYLGAGPCFVFFFPLIDLYPGVQVITGGVRLGYSFDSNVGASLAADYTSVSLGECDVVNGRGDFLGRYTPGSREFSLQLGLQLASKLGLSSRGRLLYSLLVPDWVWAEIPELRVSGGGSGLALLDDFGVTYCLNDVFTIEAALVGSGSHIDYFPLNEGTEPLPSVARIAGLGAVGRHSPVRASVLLELAKPLNRVRRFAVADIQTSAGAEVVAGEIVGANLSYFRDFLDRRSTVGCGLSLGYKDWIRASYSQNWPLAGSLGSSWQVALTANTPLQRKR